VVSGGVERYFILLRCILCGRPLTHAVQREHHISYCYEETVPVCRRCHARIHTSNLSERFKLYGVFRPIDKRSECEERPEAKMRVKEVSRVWEVVWRRARELGADPPSEMPLVHDEEDIYVYMVGVLETLGNFLEEATRYRLPGVKEMLKVFREYLQRALKIVDLALEGFENPLDHRAWEEYQRFLESVEGVTTIEVYRTSRGFSSTLPRFFWGCSDPG
jgi:hypothetical protein